MTPDGLYNLPVAIYLFVGEQGSKPPAPNFVFFGQNSSISNQFLFFKQSNSIPFCIQLHQVLSVQRTRPAISLILIDNDVESKKKKRSIQKLCVYFILYIIVYA